MKQIWQKLFIQSKLKKRAGMAGHNKLILEIRNLKNIPNQYKPVFLRVQIGS